MARTWEILAAFVPVLLLVAGGYAGQRSGKLSDPVRFGLERLGYYVFLPALLFQNLASSAIPTVLILPLFVLTVTAIAIASLAILLWCKRAGTPAERVGPLLQAAIRYNNFVGFSLLGPLFGPVGLAAGATVSAFSVIAANTISVVVLLVHAGKEAPGLRRLAAELLRNPLIQASAAGLLFKAIGPDLPGPLTRTFAMLGQAGIVTGLIVVGAALAAAPGVLVPLRSFVPASLVKFALMPALAWTIARAFDLDPLVTAAITMFFALPTAPASYILTRRLGGDADLIAGLIVAQSIVALVVLPCVVLLVAP